MTERARVRVMVRGAVQGVGFRPYVFRLATSLGLDGSVCNTGDGLLVEAEGPEPRLQEFLQRLPLEKPPHSVILSLESRFLDPVGLTGFSIEASRGGSATALILPDLATCDACRRELFDPADRRFRYPFINCTHCGPRFSIIRRLPYDRPNTTMSGFRMCPDCRSEYEDPAHRRFHAQPTACPVCGPRLALADPSGRVEAEDDPALRQAVQLLREGLIIAVKGIGGFQLLVDAASDGAVLRLRERKRREEKPFAVLYPSPEAVEKDCRVGRVEARLLAAPEAPIVLLPRRAGQGKVSAHVAPRNPLLGVMLPYSPLHHLLCADFGGPLVATSGNLSDEPICTGNEEAFRRLGGIADAFLVHNRPIARHVDDSVVRVLAGRELVVRRARGYAPLPLSLKLEPGPALATGAHLKNTVAVSVGRDLFVSQHIGDLDTAPAVDAHIQATNDLLRLWKVQPAKVACDLHPDYGSTRRACQLDPRPLRIQHHLAHVLACMAENELEPPCLGIAWDGTGYGLDHTVWGGEFIRVEAAEWRREAWFRTFPLPGGEQAIREPRRTALGLLHELDGPGVESTCPELKDAFTPQEWTVLLRMLATGTHCPRTSSVGRLFDAVSSLVGLRHAARFEGQAAMEVEFALPDAPDDDAYPFSLQPVGEHLVVDWEPCVRRLLADRRAGRPVAEIVAQFHQGLVAAAVTVALRLNEGKIALSGGCFQNRFLTERLIRRLCEEGFQVYWHQRIPPNDGGIAVGQLAAVAFGFGSVEDVSGDTRQAGQRRG
jgi:hydrogenase maturation protein HypF